MKTTITTFKLENSLITLFFYNKNGLTFNRTNTKTSDKFGFLVKKVWHLKDITCD